MTAMSFRGKFPRMCRECAAKVIIRQIEIIVIVDKVLKAKSLLTLTGRKNIKLMTFGLMLISAISCHVLTVAAASAEPLQKLASELQIKVTLVNNQAAGECEAKGIKPPCFHARLSIDSPLEFARENYAIYFSNPAFIVADLNEQFDIEHINGDLYRLLATHSLMSKTTLANDRKIYSQQQGLAKQSSPKQKRANKNGQLQNSFHYQIDYLATNWQLSEFDVLPNYYLVDANGQTAVIDSTKSQIDKDTGEEYMPHSVAFSDYQRQGKRSALDNTQWPTAESLYRRNNEITQPTNNSPVRIIPAFAEVKRHHGKLSLSKGLLLMPNRWQIGKDNPALIRLQKLGLAVRLQDAQVASSIEMAGAVQLKLIADQSIVAAEGYRLDITSSSIEIRSSTETGAFYGLVSVAALVTAGEKTLPLLSATDEPHYAYRGLHLDLARHFRSKQWLFKLLDQMAAYKLNKLHLHLGDDEGWRLQIKGLPELTEIGAIQCHDLTETKCLLPQLGHGPNAGQKQYLTESDYLQLLQEAAVRHIQLIPSFDMPGHSRASIKAMDIAEQRLQAENKPSLLLSEPADKSHYLSVQYYKDNTLNVCQPSTYLFIETILLALKRMHQQAGHPLQTYHIGADETAGAWTRSPNCQRLRKAEKLSEEQLPGYFLLRVTSLLKQHHIQSAGWGDGMSHLLDDERMPGNQVNVWTPLYWQGAQRANQFANKGWNVVLSLPEVSYFDFAYQPSPKERGYYWGARAIDSRKVFEWMPDNLPLHAEIWRDRENNPYQITEVATDGADDKRQSLKPGVKFAGIQGHLWGEQIRSDQIAERMLMPRLLALAERAWHKADWVPAYRHQGGEYSANSHFFSAQSKQRRESDWNQFAAVLGQRELPKLEAGNWFFRLPTVGASIKEGRLQLNTILPGFSLYYRFDNQSWQRWHPAAAPIVPGKVRKIEVRSSLPSEKRFSRIVELKL